MVSASAFARGEIRIYACQGGATALRNLTGQSLSTYACYPGAQALVLVNGSTTPATIYNSSGNVISSTITTNANALADFFVDDGTYAVSFSGAGIPVPWTVSGIRVANSQSTLAVACGGTDDTTAIATAYAAISTTNITKLILSGRCVTTGTLAPVSNVSVEGNGGGIYPATEIDYNSTGFWIDLPGSVKVDGFALRNLHIKISAVGLGAVRVGRTSTALDPTLFRDGWHFDDLYIQGPGPAVTGLLGVSLTQLEQGTFSNLRVSDFEQCWLNDRTSADFLSNITITGFLRGIEWRQNGGNASHDSAVMLNVVGPMTGNSGSGWLVKMDNEGNHISNSFFEVLTSGVVAKAFIWFTAAGRGNSIDSSSFQISAGTVNNSFVFDDSSLNNRFGSCFGYSQAAGNDLPAMSIGNVIVGGVSGDMRHGFVGCDSHFNAAVQAADMPGKAYIIGSTLLSSNPLLRLGQFYSGAQGAPAQFVGINTGGVFDFQMDQVVGGVANWRFRTTTGALSAQFDQNGDISAGRNVNAGTGGVLQSSSSTFAGLGSVPTANGGIIYCSDCTKTTPCAGSGTGAMAKRVNGAWDCN